MTAASVPILGSGTGKKLHGYEFYESIGRPRYVIAPMVDQSELVSRQSERMVRGEPFEGCILG